MTKMSGHWDRKERDINDFFNMTGVTANRIRTPSPPSPHRLVHYDVTSHASPLHIDLYNIEDTQFENSKYVLTSPRSLEACSRLAIRPVELLPKPLIEFQEDLLPRNIPLRTVYEVYDEHERERQNKLEMCREEREKLLLEDSIRKTPYRSPQVVLSPDRDVYSQELTANKHTGPDPYAGGDSETNSDKDHGEKDTGSLQRRRTAWTTSIGHDRVTQDELDRRAKELFEKGRELKLALNSEVKNVEKLKSKKRVTISTKGKSVLVPKKKTSRQNEGRKHKRQHGLDKKNYSTSDLSASTTRSSRSPWHRSATMEAKPITDPALCGKLKSARIPGTRLPPKRSASFQTGTPKARDQKILELMLAKREEEKQLSAQREAAKMQWESERQRESIARNAAMNRRRKSLTETRKSREDLKKSVLDKQRKEEEDEQKDQEASVEYCHKNWASQSEAQLRLKEQKQLERKQQNMLRKKTVEQRHELLEQEKQEMKKAILEKQERDIHRAQSMREIKEQEQAKQRKLKNYYTKKKVEERKTAIEKQSEEEREFMRSQLDQRLSQASNHLCDRQYSKHSELRRSQQDLDIRLSKSRTNKQKLEDELNSWHTDLLKYRQMCERRAEQVAQEKVAAKRKKALEERKQKEKLVKQNMKKLLEQEEEWKADVEATIAMKDARSKMLQMEKEETVQELRAMAEASQRLREELRSAYSSDHIDQLSRKAELEARLGAGVNHATKNMSTLTLS